MKGYRVLAAAVAGLLLAATANAPVVADVLHLTNGGRIVVGRWWIDGDTLFYETNAGSIGVARTDVTSIEASAPPRADVAPQPADPAALPRSGAATGDDKSNGGDGTAPVTTAAPANPAPPPALATGSPRAKEDAGPSEDELTAAIDRTQDDLRRAGSAELRARLSDRLGDMYVLRARRERTRGAVAPAADDYQRALRWVPRHRFARAEAATLELDLGRPERARGIVDSALADTPDDALLLVVRADLKYRDGDLGDALVDAQRALELRPGDTSIVAMIEKFSREVAAEGAHRRATSQHFLISFDGDTDEALGRMLLDTLEDAFGDLTRELDVYPTAPIGVVLYTRQQFQDTSGKGADVLGLFDGKIRLPVAGVRKVDAPLTRVVRHELCHALLHVKGRGQVPRWLHEGLAQLMEPRDVGAKASAEMAAQADKGELSIEPFAYPTALSFVRFLDATQSRARLLWLIDLVAGGASEANAFQRAFGASRQESIDEWSRRLARGN